ncbi:hypothetical protein IFT68_22690 [Oxalobacteraceae sp. CFBP 13730]|nr:hypothetical protein [Oxalobacteraceae sp. CFBP 13730]
MMADLAEVDKAYIVVRDPACLGSLHGDISKVIVRANKNVSYRGIDRDPWWNLDELFYAGLLDADLTALRQAIERQRFRGFSFGVCDSLDIALRIQALSPRGPLIDEIICITSALDTVHEADVFFGYDCYVDGFGSLLRLGAFSGTTAFADYENQLNEYGLFSSLVRLHNYVEVYCARCEQADVEVIEASRISNGCFVKVWGASTCLEE